jgi:hypothetical protein
MLIHLDVAVLMIRGPICWAPLNSTVPVSFEPTSPVAPYPGFSPSPSPASPPRSQFQILETTERSRPPPRSDPPPARCGKPATTSVPHSQSQVNHRNFKSSHPARVPPPPLFPAAPASPEPATRPAPPLGRPVHADTLASWRRSMSRSFFPTCSSQKGARRSPHRYFFSCFGFRVDVLL